MRIAKRRWFRKFTLVQLLVNKYGGVDIEIRLVVRFVHALPAVVEVMLAMI
jgi:hypothetical protein